MCFFKVLGFGIKVLGFGILAMAAISYLSDINKSEVY